MTGPLQTRLSQPPTRIVSFFNEVALDDQLKQFWELEELPRRKYFTEDETFCEKLFEETTVRKDDGRNEVRLPFKPEADKTLLYDSKVIARSVFLRNENRLLKTPDFKQEYDRVLSEYIDLKHMTEVTNDDVDGYYLPHHAVIKPDSTTTKVRVVFNASSRSRSGTSLNDLLFIGPTLQADLMKLLLNWRFFKFVFNGDIEKMYRQILVHPDDTKYQRILFRGSSEEDLKEYELQTVTFGVNCAPYLAIRTLLKLSEDVKNEFPLASKILNENMYVDDA